MTDEPARAESAAELSFRMGEALLRNGAEIFRVQETMERVAHAYGIEEYNVYVLSNAIFANAVENGQRVETKLRFIPGSTIHFGRIAGINQLSREIARRRRLHFRSLRPPAFDRAYSLYASRWRSHWPRRRQRLLQLSVRRLGVRRARRAALRRRIAGFPESHRPAHGFQIHHESRLQRAGRLLCRRAPFARPRKQPR